MKSRRGLAHNQSGFAIALDALMAIILVTTIIVFLSSQPLTRFPTIDSSQRLSQNVSSAFTAMDISGELPGALVDRQITQGAVNDLFDKAKRLMPENTGLALAVTAYDVKNDEDLENCRTTGNFEQCFLDNPAWFVQSDQFSVLPAIPEECDYLNFSLEECVIQNQTNPPAIPKDHDVVYGKKLVMTGQIPDDSAGPSSVSCETVELKKAVAPQNSSVAFFQAAPILEFQASVNPGGSATILACANSELTGPSAEVTIQARNRTRNPIEVALVIDRSGSMNQYDMPLDAVKDVNVSDGTCNLGNPDANVACTSLPQLQTNCGYSSTMSTGVCGSPYDASYVNWQFLETFDVNAQIMNLLKTDNSYLQFTQTPQNYPNFFRLGECGECTTNFSPFVKAIRQRGPFNGLLNSQGGGYTYFSKPQLQSGDQISVSSWKDTATSTSLDVYAGAYTNNLQTGTTGLLHSQESNCLLDYSNADYQVVNSVTLPTDPNISEPNRLTALDLIADWSGFTLPVGACSVKGKIRYTATGLTPNSDVATCNDGDCSDGYCCRPAYCENTAGCPYSWFSKISQNNGPGFTIGGSPDYSIANQPTGSPYYGNYNQYLPAGQYDLLLASSVDFPAGTIKNKLSYWQTVKELGKNTTTAGQCANGTNCVYDTTQTSTCPLPEYNSGGNCFFDPNQWQSPSFPKNCTATNEKLVSRLTISSSDHLRGLLMVATSKNYAGTCLNAMMGVRYPAGVTPILNATRSINPSQIITKKFGLNTTEYLNTTAPITALQGIPAGNYDFYAWVPNPSTPTLMDVNVFQQRIDAVKSASKNFIDNSNWSQEDHLGLVSYSNNATTDSSLLALNSGNKTILKNKLNELVPSGETWTADGLAQARTILAGESDASKYIILLSDGLANLPNPGNPAGDAVAQALAAYCENGATCPTGQTSIRTFTIAFGNEALDESTESGCSLNLEQIAAAGGGECYAANDPNELLQIYNLITAQIQQELSTTDIVMPLYNGISIKNPRCEQIGQNPNDCTGGIWLRSPGVSDVAWDDVPKDPLPDWFRVETENLSLVFKNVLINKTDLAQWWTAKFDVAVPCDSSQCISTLFFPPAPATEVIEQDAQGYRIPWDALDQNPDFVEQATITVSNNDLQFEFLSGEIDSGFINLDYEIKNTGSSNFEFSGVSQNEQGLGGIGPCNNGLVLQIYKNLQEEPPEFENPLPTPPSIYQIVPSECVQPTPTLLEPGDAFSGTATVDATPDNQGILYGIIQPPAPISECRQNNWDKIRCIANPKNRFFLVEYWSWIK